MKAFRLLAIPTISLALAISTIASAQTYISVDYPGAVATYLNGGPNLQGDSVGSWQDATGTWHGFVLTNRSKFISFDPPGSISTYPSWITLQGYITGAYYDGNFILHGFILRNGKYTTVDYPGAAGTSLGGMNLLGESVGNYCVDTDCTVTHSFKRSWKGEFTAFDPPNASESSALTINDFGDIVGGYWTAYPEANAAEHGYLLSRGKFTTIDFPADGAYGSFCGANNFQGDVVGSYYDSNDYAHSFLLKNRKFKSFDYPGALYTFAGGISPTGVIVGAYYDSAFNEHGFIRKP